MKPVIPHEHGGWALLIVPFLLGTFLGNPSWKHLLLFMAWLLFYMSTYAWKEWIKRHKRDKRFLNWASIYGLTGLPFMIIPVLEEPTLILIAPFLLLSVIVHLYHIRKKNERAMGNNLGAVHAFSMGAIAAYVLGTGQWDFTTLFLYIYCSIFFLGTVFFVKSNIRERKNPHWIRYSKYYHWFMLFVPILLGHPWLTIPFLFPLMRLYRWGGTNIKPIQVGIIEIGNAFQYVLLSLWLM